MSVNTDVGQVTIIGRDQVIPEGWRVLTFEEGSQVKSQISQLLDEWGIVAFDRGKLDGFGYGNKLMEQAGPECGQIFIVKC